MTNFITAPKNITSQDNLEWMHYANLSDIDFFASDLSKATFKNTDLSNSYLSECDIRATVFDWANLDGALLDNVKFDKSTSFLGVDIHKVNFTLATLLYDLALTQQRIQQLLQQYLNLILGN